MHFVALDFETGDYAPNSAVSIGLVKYTNGKKTDEYYSLICPPKLYIRPDFTEIHGLRVKDVEDAPLFSQIWAAVKEFIGDFPVIAHNAGFDMGVLCALIAHYKLDLPSIQYYDSVFIARKTWPELACHKLTFLGQNFGIQYEAHNALADSDTCAQIIVKAAEKQGAKKLADLSPRYYQLKKLWERKFG
ncbi:MAG TPA: 3'-5' exonuclease [Treponemataceae bacterium]|jgi:DNA polymerase-3 subunit epsilon|nr:3'-5' exonuclease [Spirochaetota bacterium]HBG36856.1 exonuclease [Treponema sp.]HOQ92220.1 3'-5' exonuclease [Treponemataceae bacterium]HPM05428.1 3'-5' exonuclease [Treponemataceae bacterium]HPY52393.1 3'-5' exonuclease [Treponemataceae bacterium]